MGGEETKLLDDSDGGGDGRAPGKDDEYVTAPGCARVMNEEVTDSCLCFLKVFSVATMAAGALIIAVNVYEIIDFAESYQTYAVRGYAILFGLMIILAELEFPRLFLDYFKFLEVWSMKGLFIVFVGVLTLDTEFANSSLLQTATAVIIAVLGAVYFLFGLLCVKTYRDYRKQGLHASVDKQASKERREASRDLTPPPAPPAAAAGEPSWLDPQQDLGV